MGMLYFSNFDDYTQERIEKACGKWMATRDEGERRAKKNQSNRGVGEDEGEGMTNFKVRGARGGHLRTGQGTARRHMRTGRGTARITCEQAGGLLAGTCEQAGGPFVGSGRAGSIDLLVRNQQYTKCWGSR